MVEDRILKELREADTYSDHFSRADFDQFAGVAGSNELVAETQVRRPHALAEGVPVDVAIMAYEEFTADGTAGNSETLNLSHDPVESTATAEPIVVYEDDSRLAIDSRDYENDTVTVTPANADSTLGVFYASGEQARVAVQKTAPAAKAQETLWSGDTGLIHLRDTAREPITLEFGSSPLQAVIPTDWRLQVYVDAPYTARFAKDIGGDGNEEVASNSLLGFQYRATRDEIEGLKTAVAQDSAGR
ncbi:hypothetical protein JCM30237_12370 [Halolamina litorea]|uniref:Uncharacterized protein n=1 Tax=Halolamina litorea TaxID=1515593 RepID=A0ABD6BN30_9EURY|nr:hypothetical protein [Halolamina litorea]